MSDTPPPTPKQRRLSLQEIVARYHKDVEITAPRSEVLDEFYRQLEVYLDTPYITRGPEFIFKGNLRQSELDWLYTMRDIMIRPNLSPDKLNEWGGVTEYYWDIELTRRFNMVTDPGGSLKKIPVTIVWDEEDQRYVGKCPSVAGIIAYGTSRYQCLRELESVIEVYREAAIEAGLDIT